MARISENPHPYLTKGFWKENRFWDSGWYSEETKQSLDKWAENLNN